MRARRNASSRHAKQQRSKIHANSQDAPSDSPILRILAGFTARPQTFPACKTPIFTLKIGLLMAGHWREIRPNLVKIRSNLPKSPFSPILMRSPCRRVAARKEYFREQDCPFSSFTP